MTARCGGGTSAPDIGLDIAAAYSAGRIAQLLVAAGLSELSAWLPLVGIIPIVYGTFCASDPPTMVALTQAESDALATNTINGDFFSGLGKFKDICLNIIWDEVCRCTSGTFTPVTPPAINVNTPVFQPPVPQPTVACAVQTLNWGPQNVTNTGTFVGSGIPPIGANVTSYRVTDTILTDASGSGIATVTTPQPNTSPLIGVTSSGVRAAGTSIQETARWFSNATSVAVTITSLAANSMASGRVDFEFFCNGDVPGGTHQPCCPPDPATQAYLDLIFQQVTLLQRQLAPFSYVYGANHTGLSGTGSIAVQGLLGISVDVTTLPTPYGQRAGTPTELFDLGYVTLGTPDGYSRSVRVDHDGTLVMPDRMSVYTVLGYTLSPGVVVSIRELVREP